MGAMRLPVIDGVYPNIDEEETSSMVAYAMEHGINYYDTAWGYHDGQSEIAIGNVLAQYPRENYYLATKFPGSFLNVYSKCNSGAVRNVKLRTAGRKYQYI